MGAGTTRVFYTAAKSVQAVPSPLIPTISFAPRYDANSIVNSLLTTRRALGMILGFGVFAMAARNALDPDMWWHLRTGQLILQNHAVFHADPYSFTRAGVLWVNHEWLSDILMFALYRFTGWTGLIAAFAVIISATFVLVFRRCQGSASLAALVTVWAAFATSPVWGVRPQMISLLLASVLLTLRETDRRLAWWIVPLMWLWANLHAGFALGIVLLLLFFLGDAIDVLLGAQPWPEAKPLLERLGMILAASLAVIPLNPYGFRLFSYPLETLRSPGMQNFIVEWFSPNFHDLNYLPFLAFLLTTIVAVGSVPRRLSASQLLLLVVTLFAALRSVRNISIFVLVAAPLLFEGLSACLRRMSSNPSPAPTRRGLILNGAMVLAVAVFALVRVQTVAVQQSEAEAAQFPAAAVAYLAANHLPQPMLNHYNWGGYLIWKLYPDYRVFIDGRADVYGDSLMEDFASVYYLNRNWKKPLEQWKIQTVILPPEAPLLQALESTGGWRQAYSDGQARIFVRTQ